MWLDQGLVEGGGCPGAGITSVALDQAMSGGHPCAGWAGRQLVGMGARWLDQAHLSNVPGAASACS